MSCELLILYDDSDNLIKLNGLTKKVGGVDAYSNAATVQLTDLTDSTGTTVTGFSAVTLSYIAASNGNYEGVLPVTVDLTVEEEYTGTIVATADGLTKTWKPAFLVKRDYE